MAKMASCSGTPIGTIHATMPVTIAAAPSQTRKKPGATISAAASRTPIDNHAQCGSMFAIQSGMSAAPFAAGQRILGQFADAAERAAQLGRPDGGQDRLGIGGGRELAGRPDI